MALPVSITSIRSFSPLGFATQEVWQNYLSPDTHITSAEIGKYKLPVAELDAVLKNNVEDLKNSDPKYFNLDETVLYAILASRAAVSDAGWNKNDAFGINIGSSRGATSLFEKYHQEYLSTGIVGPHASPSTTLGNISSWVAHDLNSNGPEISHSITCSTSLHAVLNAIAWIGSGMASKFLVGGSEASLTPFTMAQLKAMKIYSSIEGPYPSRAMDFDKKNNSMVLGEGAVSACLEKGFAPHALAIIEGIGYATEVLQHSASLSADAQCLQRAMEMAIGDKDPDTIDAVVMHAPGTVKGDIAEYNAIKNIFANNLPLLTTNKWKTGHTFGASGLLSLEMAVLMIKHNQFVPVPFVQQISTGKAIRKVLVNAIGFGGNAVSILVSASN